MKTSTSHERHGIKWTACMQLNVLDFADDLAHTHQQIQVKKVSVAAASASVGLDIHKKKSKVLKYSTESINSIILDREVLKQVKTLTFLGIINEKQRGSDADVKEKIGKTRTAFLQLKNVRNSKQLSSNIKVRIFSTNVKTVPLYVAETWRTTITIIKKVQAFINDNLKDISKPLAG
ncbi:unnamed protein product [Schistosoma mattheei]|uniref:Uncharacterized protein n=1 Tax=Schistosoma mattheei TaxID=31246 RepID=A0A183P0U6_9TREM|nr:unnamed protein product [Schistosoma mattheei]